jgi:hypothetical protein
LQVVVAVALVITVLVVELVVIVILGQKIHILVEIHL